MVAQWRCPRLQGCNTARAIAHQLLHPRVQNVEAAFEALRPIVGVLLFRNLVAAS